MTKPLSRIATIIFNYRLICAVTAAAAAFLAAPAANADPINFVQNGSFGNTVNFNPSGTGSEVTNSNLPGWQLSTCVSGCNGGPSNVYSFLLQSNYATNGFYVGEYYNQHDSFYGGGPGASPDGGNSYAADGGYQIGKLSQSITGLTAGQTYQLSFYQASAEQSGFPGAFTASWQVGLGNQTQNSTAMVTPSQSSTGWVEDTMDFTANAVNEVLWFMSTSTNGYPPFLLLDGVSLTAVPEPASIGLLGAGVLGMLFIARRRRSSAA